MDVENLINVTNTYECANNDTTGFEETVAKIVSVFFGVIGITGLFGNALVVLVVLSNAQMRSTTNLLILNLASADLLFVIFCIPFTATDYVTATWPFGDLWCKIVQYLIVVTAHASIYTLVLMSMDRFLAVVYPIASRSWRTEQITCRAISILWIIILTTSIPVIFAHGVVEYKNEGVSSASCRFKNNDITYTAFHIIFFSTSYLIPLILITGLYLRMCMRLWRTVVSGRSTTSESYRGRKRVTRLVVVVVTAFATLWFPIQMILLLKSIGIYQVCTRFEILLQIFSQTLAYTSSCINPVLYAFLSENFRKAFKKVVYFGPIAERYSHHQPLPSKSSRTGSTICGDNV